MRPIPPTEDQMVWKYKIYTQYTYCVATRGVKLSGYVYVVVWKLRTLDLYFPMEKFFPVRSSPE